MRPCVHLTSPLKRYANSTRGKTTASEAGSTVFAGVRFAETDGPQLYLCAREEQAAAELR
jgi:hypothetical protein